MLRSLRIQHFALIDEVQLDFKQGFTVFTGETGSGKSIILAATHLILGERADLQVIAPGAKKAIVEAEFELSQDYLPFFEANDLDFEPQTLIRREIASEGKSRAFINDIPVSLQVLKQLTSNLLQIHSQYNTLELKSKRFQLELMDTLLGLQPAQQAFAHAFAQLQQLQKEAQAKQQAYAQDQLQQDYNTFLLEELQALQLHDPKIQQLEQEIERYASASQLEEARAGLASLTDDNGPYSQLYAIKSILDKVKAIDPDMKSYAERLQQVLIELKELAADAAANSFADLEPADLQALEALQDKINAALLKHRARDVAALQAIQETLLQKSRGLEDQAAELESLQQQSAALEKELWLSAQQLHQQRKDGAGQLALQLAAILEELKLPHTKLAFELQALDQLNTFGCSQLALLFSANLGHSLVPVERAASGGELSRLMLALQKMISEKKALPTIIFDEIDTGVSGDVALKIGKLLNEMSAKGQCMAISHLPQVAANAAHHWMVQKTVIGERMQTNVLHLDAAARVNEIARLLSGEVITPAAVANAKALLQGA
ncbi:MAG: AAA family ATPase [Crocinitomicaceae bacterium]|jgi:DNA repair protein RecN (Recombination protein N)|nr:AAA family ATPase [Crocinitomicaceae bacterium]MDP4724234.1 AAA family ATPase [Crocinitomicaceae bacterium]MDP4739648.1 AAA family ATPase [Crocinitomicaceae bacterium]MDP4799676.1 AAA family ATPase [Crocinitomicaceae bacterium]MDP4805864.1 AAA family ATPase [Crocinitomicaceae bacterium]